MAERFAPFPGRAVSLTNLKISVLLKDKQENNLNNMYLNNNKILNNMAQGAVSSTFRAIST